MSIGLIVIASLAALAITAVCFAWYTEEIQTGNTEAVAITYSMSMLVLFLFVIILAVALPA